MVPHLGAAKQAIGIAESALKVPYNIGESVSPRVTSDIASSFSNMSALDTARVGGVPAQILGNIYKGGVAFEAFADYEKISAASEKQASPLISQYESDLAKYNAEFKNYSVAKTAYESKLSEYNTALDAYNQNKTQEGYNKLTAMQRELEASKPVAAYENLASMKLNLESQQTGISSAMLPAEIAKQNYAKSASAIVGNVDQRTLLTYGVGKIIGDIGTGYKTNIETPIRAFVAPAGSVGEFISGVASVPTQMATIGQSSLVAKRLCAARAIYQDLPHPA